MSLRTGYSPSGVANALARHGIDRRATRHTSARRTGKQGIPTNPAPSTAGPRRVAPTSGPPTGGSHDRHVEPPAKRDHRAEWFASLRRAEEYIARSGFPRQRDVTADGWKPGKWIARQKEDWDRLSQEQRDALAALPGFAHDAREAHFDAMVAVYLRARATRGLEAPFGKRWVFEGYPLGQWLHDLERGRTRLTPERREKLRQVGLLR